MRYPLIESQGNFGNIDGDNATAAYRYTEALRVGDTRLYAVMCNRGLRSLHVRHSERCTRSMMTSDGRGIVMNTYLLIRASDHIVLGIGWTRMTTSVDAEGRAILTANENATLVATFAPQHVAEETSSPRTEAPLNPPSAAEGGTVPAWQAVLSGPSRLTVTVAPGVKIPLTVAGILKALADGDVSTTGPDGTRLEIPARLFITPVDGTGALECTHLVDPGTRDGVTGMWRTRIRNSSASAMGLRAVDYLRGDPTFRIPLTSAQRKIVVDQSGEKAAQLTRLELSTIGGTLDVASPWINAEWDHHCVLGRDMAVRFQMSGALYPLGHRAKLLEYTIRDFDADRTAGGAAVLRTVRVLTITEPVRDQSPDGRVRREFPFHRVEILQSTYTDLDITTTPETFTVGGTTFGTHHWLRDGNGRNISFAVRATTSTGTVDFALPLVFVIDHRPRFDSLSDAALTRKLKSFYGSTPVQLPGIAIDLVGATTRLAGDVHEVHGITIAGVEIAPGLTDGYRPRCAALSVAIPALRTLLGTGAPQLMKFAERFVSGGSDDIPLVLADRARAIEIDFTKSSDRSGGLVAPRSAANAISRSMGPVDETFRPDKLFGPEATLLGFPLRALLADLRAPPQITSALTNGASPEVTMNWNDVRLNPVNPCPGFETTAATRLDLKVRQGPTASKTECTISNFTLAFPPTRSVLRLSLESVEYHQTDGQPPDLTMTGPALAFDGDLKFIDDLKKVMDAFGAAGKFVDISPSAISVRYRLMAPPIASGAFVLSNIAFNVGIRVPFQGAPSISLGFSSRALPFQLSVLMFGGTGYAEIALSQRGIETFEAALEFGALVAINFVIARAEVHALGGVRFELQADRSVIITGYLRIGGSVDVLGLVSVSIELIIALSYRSASNALVGRATLVIVIDLTLWSDSMEIDSGEWYFAGSGPRRRLDDATAFKRWQRYRNAFIDELPGDRPAVKLAYEADA